MKLRLVQIMGTHLACMALLVSACNHADAPQPEPVAQQLNSNSTDEPLSEDRAMAALPQSDPRQELSESTKEHALPVKHITVEEKTAQDQKDGLPDLTNPSLLTLSALGQVWGMFACEITPKCMGAMGSAVLMSMGGSAEICKSTFKKQFENSTLPSLKEATNNGRVIFRKELLQGCIDAMTICSSLNVQAIRECSLVLEGTVELGGSCTMTSECQNGTRCNGCKCVSMGQQGDDCITEEHCQSGLSCTYASPDDTEGTCTQLLAEGEICSGSNDCSWPMLCAPDYTVYDNTCQHISDLKHAKLGQSCHPMMAILCEEGLSCAVVGQQFKCIQAVSSGKSCSYGLPDPCPSDEFCGVDLIGGKVTGKCTARGKSGDSCASLNPLACAAGYVCNTASLSCMKLRENGAACATSKQCWSEQCSGGFCVSSAPKGPMCLSDF